LFNILILPIHYKTKRTTMATTTGPCPHDPTKQCPRSLVLTLSLPAGAEVTSTVQENNRIKVDIPTLDTVSVKPNKSISPSSLPAPELGPNTELKIFYTLNGTAKQQVHPLTVMFKSNEYWIIHKAQ